MKERIIRVTVSSLVLLSLILVYFVHVYWLGLAILVGLSLFYSSFTRFCPLEKILDKAGVDDSAKSRK
jgi:hypothetical protein